MIDKTFCNRHCPPLGWAGPAMPARIVDRVKEEPVSLCTHCRKRPIPPKNRRYCAACSPKASRIWKARERRRWSAEWRTSNRTGPPPYLDGWASVEERRAYYRRYMREWRRKRKNSQPDQDSTRNP